MVPGPPVSASTENLIAMHIFSPHIDLLNLKIWGGAQKPVLTSPPVDPDPCSSLRTTALLHSLVSS